MTTQSNLEEKEFVLVYRVHIERAVQQQEVRVRI